MRPLVAADAVRLQAGAEYTRPLDTQAAWVKSAHGHLYVCGTELHAGEGVLLEHEPLLAAFAETDSVLLIIELEGKKTP